MTWCILSKDLDATEGAKKGVDSEQSTDDGSHPDLFEENFLELRKWVDVKSSKYGILTVTRERRSQRLGTALKVFLFKNVTLVAAWMIIHQFELLTVSYDSGVHQV